MYTLITAANSAKAYRVKNELGSANIILGDYDELPELMLKKGDMIKLPNPSSNAYAHQMLALCLDKQINTIYPLRDKEAALLKEAGQLFNEYGIRIVHGS